MKKFLLIALLVMVGVPASILIAGSMRPANYHVERSATVPAPPDAVYAVLSDFHRFGEWSPWEKLDPGMQKTFEGQNGAVGSSYSWSGNDRVGAGSMTVTEAQPGKKLAAKMQMNRPYISTSQTYWTLEGQGNQTKVTWAMDGESRTLIAKTFTMLMNMDKMIGSNYETGLDQLKSVAEAEAKKRAVAQTAVAPAENPTAAQ
jgi:uncharacterized protein YndB with AHSA1/START domain